ncbi:MAG: hypothetical protein ACU84Q_09190 [Gammaproteobacteria bacterium]
MTLQDLGNLGELIGAIAVVISLIYIAVQIRQNTWTVRASTEQAVFESAIDLDRIILTDPEFSRIWYLGRSSPDALDKEKARRFRRLMSMFYRNFENVYFQHKKGLVDDGIFERWGTIVSHVSRQPGAERWWEFHNEVLTEEFRKFIEGRRLD